MNQYVKHARPQQLLQDVDPDEIRTRNLRPREYRVAHVVPTVVISPDRSALFGKDACWLINPPGWAGWAVA